jgi:hypothetical protein
MKFMTFFKGSASYKSVGTSGMYSHTTAFATKKL